jgi:thiol-disulfide isomerase/thioredoxin
MSSLFSICRRILVAFLISIAFFWSSMTPAEAAINDDRFDGNIFVLYAGNGSLVPPRFSLADSLRTKKPSILVFYLDDSKDCKQFAGVVSQLQADYGRAASLIPVSVDSLIGQQYPKTEPGYYYSGKVPQTVVLDETGKVVFNEAGNTNFDRIDIALRQVFKRPARTGNQLEQRSFNEFNSEMSK